MYLKNINYVYNNFEAIKHVLYDDETNIFKVVPIAFLNVWNKCIN